MYNMQQEHNRDLPMELPPKLYNALEDLCIKWDEFSYDKVIRKHYIKDGEEIDVWYVHEWVDPPTKSFREFLLESVIPKHFTPKCVNLMSDLEMKLIIQGVCATFRDKYLRKQGAEHCEEYDDNPRENGIVDSEEYIRVDAGDQPSRTMTCIGPLGYTEYWLL